MAQHHPFPLLFPLAAALAVAAPAQSPSAFTFTAIASVPHTLGSAGYSGCLRVVDLDGDSYPDVLMSSSSTTVVGRNNQPASAGFALTTVAGLGGGQAHGVDLDGDGFDDILVADSSTMTLRYVLNDGTGGFPGPIGSFTVGGTTIRSLVIANFDADAQPEIAVHKRVGSPTQVDLLDVIPGTPLPSLSLAANYVLGSDGSGYQTATALDVEGDGDLDLIGQTGIILYNQLDTAPTATSPTFASGAGTGQITWAKTMTTGDVSGDSMPDLVTARFNFSYAVSGIEVFVSNAACGVGSLDRLDSMWNNNYWFAEAADFDGDSKDEILASAYVGTTWNLVLLPTGPNGSAVSPSVPLFTNAQVGATADFDGDGDVDVLAWATNSLVVLDNETEALVRCEVLTESPWSPATVAPDFVWVDAASTSASPSGAADQPFARITDAVAAAPTGAAILVRPGRYAVPTEAGQLTLDGVQLIGVAGSRHTFVDDVRFTCQGGARLSGFTLRTCTGGTSSPYSPFDGMVEVRDGTVLGNQLFGGSPMSGIVVRGGGYAADIGSNVLQGWARGVLVDDGNATDGYATVRIYNNTVVDNSVGIQFGAANAVEIVNNLVLDNGSYGIERLCRSELNSLLVDYNWVYNHGIADNYVTTVAMGTTCASVSPITLEAGPHDTEATWNTAWFVNATAHDYHLTGAAAVDLGDPAAAWAQWFPIDIDGDPRSVRALGLPPWTGLAPDLGADETAAQRLTFASDATQWTFSTDQCDLCVNAVGFADSPGVLPDLFNSVLLLSPFTFNGLLTGSLGQNDISVPRDTTWAVGTRVYLQALVLDVSTGNWTLTNATVLTSD